VGLGRDDVVNVCMFSFVCVCFTLLKIGEKKSIILQQEKRKHLYVPREQQRSSGCSPSVAFDKARAWLDAEV
jgi:hypothetical protein